MPNWLGDMVMASAFINALHTKYPEAYIELIVKKELANIAAYIPTVTAIHAFDKKIISSWQFGKEIGRLKKYDLFFCLPHSFSSAQMAFATKAKKRIGFKKELRSFLLTHSYRTPAGLHRVDEYLQLLSLFVKKPVSNMGVSLLPFATGTRTAVVVNINSEAQSRRLPIAKAISLLTAIRAAISDEIILVGSPKEKAFVSAIYDALIIKKDITNLAGLTTLAASIHLLAGAKVVLTTDSGPAHIANAVGTPTIVLFGAGNEDNTGPYNTSNREIIRLGQLACEKCVSNTCKKYDEPRCLTALDNQTIIAALKKYV
ncbi:MAG: ADP-heptose--LPS heptosyltransferase 2 [Bacteroidota bacterium]|jgi:ADP-heptose:LPS heptosyltransferase